MKTRFLKTNLFQGSTFLKTLTIIFLHLIEALFKLCFHAAVAYAGYYLITNYSSWFSIILGFIFLCDASSILIPLLQILFDLTLFICYPLSVFIHSIRKRRDLKEFSEDLTLLKEIAHENLSRDTFDSLHISDFSRNILDMYDHFLLVLAWTWIEHLRTTKRNTELFISLFQQRFPSVASLYDDLLPDMELHFQAKAIEDGLYLYIPSPQEDYRLHIAYAITWSSKHLFRDDPDYLSFARVLSDSIKPFLKANNL